MKKILFLLVISFTIFSCKNAPEVSPEDMAIPSTEDGKVLLRLNPKKGDKIDMKMTMNMESTAEKMPITMDMEMDYNMETTAAQDSLFTYVLDFTRIKMSGGPEGMRMNYDSNNENEGMGAMMGKAFEPILKNKTTMVMNDLGKIIQIDWGGTKGAANPGNVDFKGMSVPLPVEAVGVGDSWTSQRELDVNNKINMLMKVTKITSSEVYIGVDGDFEGKEFESGKTTAEFGGTYILDRATSFTKTGEINIKIQNEETPVDMTMKFKAL